MSEKSKKPWSKKAEIKAPPMTELELAVRANAAILTALQDEDFAKEFHKRTKEFMAGFGDKKEGKQDGFQYVVEALRVTIGTDSIVVGSELNRAINPNSANRDMMSLGVDSGRQSQLLRMIRDDAIIKGMGWEKIQEIAGRSPDRQEFANVAMPRLDPTPPLATMLMYLDTALALAEVKRCAPQTISQFGAQATQPTYPAKPQRESSCQKT